MTWHDSPAVRKANAKKAAATRKARGEKPFGGKHGRHKGINISAHMTPAQRVQRAKQAALTRRAHRSAKV